MTRLFLILAGAVTVAGAAPRQADPPAVTDSVLEARTTALAAGLRCPVCQGLSIQDSPSELAQQMRAVVKEQLKAGKSEDEIRAFFISKYGEWVLLAPKPSGFNILVYVLPWIALAVGAFLVVGAVRRWTAPTRPDGPSDPPEPAR